MGEEYKNFREALAGEVSATGNAFAERIDVQLKRKHVDKFNNKGAFICLTERINLS